MLSPRMFLIYFQLSILSLIFFACEEFGADCTTDDHCLPHQACISYTCTNLTNFNTSGLSSDSPLEVDQGVSLDMEAGMEAGTEVDMEIDMEPDYEVDTDPFTPLHPSCSVSFVEGKSPVLEINNLGLSPKLLCVKDVLLMIAPVNDDIPNMELCYGTTVDTETNAGMDNMSSMAGEMTENTGGSEAGTVAGAEAGEMLAGLPVPDIGDTQSNRLAIYQYGKSSDESDAQPGWYRRYANKDFDPNTEFHLIEAPSDNEDLKLCNKGFLYINEKPLDTAEEPKIVSLKSSNYAIQSPYISESGKKAFSIGPKTREHAFTQIKIESNRVLNQIATEVRDEDPIFKQTCTTSFDSSVFINPKPLKTWSPTLTKFGFAWMQTHPLDDRYGELHLVSRDSITRGTDNNECDPKIIDIFDLSTQDPDELWRIPLQYNHENTLYFCRYINGGVCALNAQMTSDLASAQKAVFLKERSDEEIIYLPTAQFSVFKQYLLFVAYSDDQSRLEIQSAKLSEDNNQSHSFTFESPSYLDQGLRFPDLALYLEKPNGNKLNAYWISGHPEGWQIKTETIYSSEAK